MKGIMVVVTSILLIAGCKDSNSGSDGKNHPAAGTLSGSSYCEGTSLTQNYHNGTGGTYSEVLEENSEECGYVPPAGTILKEGCSTDYIGVKWYRIADGNGGYYSEKDNESVECGYEPPVLEVEVGAAGDTFNPTIITVNWTQYGEPITKGWSFERTEDTIGKITKTPEGLEIRGFNGKTGIGEVIIEGEQYQYEIVEEPICEHGKRDEQGYSGARYDCQGHRVSGSSQGFIYYGDDDDRIVTVSMIWWQAASNSYMTSEKVVNDPTYRKLFGQSNAYKDLAVVDMDPNSSKYASAVRVINKINEQFEKSKVYIRIELVGAVFSDYYSVSAARSMKNFMRDGKIPWADTVAQEGYSHAGTCGVAFPGTAFGRGANPRTWLNKCGYATLIHELGHNVGMAHGPNNSSNQARGYIFPDFGHGVMNYCGVARSSIMSYGHSGKRLTNSLQTCKDQDVPERYDNYWDDPAGWRDPQSPNGGSDEAYHLNRIRYNLSLITELDGQVTPPETEQEMILFSERKWEEEDFEVILD